MAIHQIMYALPSMLKTKAKFLTSTSLVFFVLVGVSNSIPIDQPNTSEQNVESEAAPIGYIPSGNFTIAYSSYLVTSGKFVNVKRLII